MADGSFRGSALVLHYACKHPERVSGLVLLGAAASVSPLDGLAAMGRATSRSGNEPWFAAAMKAQMTVPKTDDEFRAILSKTMPLYWSDPSRFDKHKEHFTASTFSSEAERGGLESERMPYDLSSQLKKVSAPVPIVAGDADLLVPLESSARLHLCLPNSETAVDRGLRSLPMAGASGCVQCAGAEVPGDGSGLQPKP